MPRLRELASIHPHKVAIHTTDGLCLSYAQLYERANRVAHWLLSRGLPEGAAVALLLENRLLTPSSCGGVRVARACTTSRSVPI
jgi:acyl-CoA synthetase (AMP-forming)/AMP-acid ligase II